MQSSSETEDLECVICNHAFHPSDEVNIPTCCATESEQKLICSTCMPRLQKQCPYCKHPSVQDHHVRLNLDIPFLLKHEHTLPTKISLNVLRLIETYYGKKMTDKQADSCSFLQTWLAQPEPNPVQRIELLSGFIASAYLIPERDLDPTKVSELEQFPVALCCMIAMMTTPTLALPTTLRRTLWTVHDHFSKTLNKQQTDSLIKISVAKPDMHHLIDAFQHFKAHTQAHPIFCLVFMAKIQHSLGEPHKAQTLLQRILELKPAEPTTLLDHAGHYFAYTELKKMGATTHDAYLLYHAKHCQQDPNLNETARHDAAITATMTAIRVPQPTCLDASIGYLDQLIHAEPSEKLLKDVIRLSIELLKRNQAGKPLRTLLDHCQLTPLFQAPVTSSGIGNWLIGLVRQSNDTLTPDYADALINPEKHLYLQKENYQLFFTRLKKTPVNILVIALYEKIEKKLRQKRAMIDFRY